MDEFTRDEQVSKLLAEGGEDFHRIGEYGFVRLVDKMGSDASIVQAARVSYGKGTKTPSDDYALIYHLIRNGHTSPLEMIELKFHSSLPIFLARQQIRHRTASVNEYSGRYSEMPDELWEPSLGDIRNQIGLNKQGSEGRNPNGDQISQLIGENNREAYERYQTLLALGCPREQARVVLPLSTYTQWYWKIDGNNFLKFIGLRMDSHAQSEFQEYARAYWAIFEKHYPLTAQAYRAAVLDGARLTGPMLGVIRRLLGAHLDGPENDWARLSLKSASDGLGLRKSEAAELEKLIFGSNANAP